ncbi:DMT family transporter [uncultured Ruegeria sp.]|uniref:DMT family transporter n=1 Tax=uncultured Ruegeria sp. TaxID=259304 RepID=UPI002603C2E8|nr:DMT family transporter [uncultured Ruegeria sp.]
MKFDTHAHKTTRLSRSVFYGQVLVILSAVLFALSGVFVKSIAADGWTVIVLRGVFVAIAFCLIMFFRGTWRTEVKAFGWAALAAAFFATISGVAFVLAFKYTTIANVALIYATAPFLAALIAWAWYGAHPSKVVMTCGGIALLGVTIIVRGSVGGGNLFGDGLALTMTAAMATYLCLYRRYPETPTTLPLLMASVIPLIVSMAPSIELSITTQDIWKVALFALSFCASSLLLVEGSKLISSAEAALLSALETPLAPLFALLILGSVPSLETLIGGVIISLAVLASLMWSADG